MKHLSQLIVEFQKAEGIEAKTDLALAIADTVADCGRGPAECLDLFCDSVHEANKKWWTDLETGQPKQRNVGELLMLCVSELAEALEGHRKDLMDDKLPHRKMIEVELADCIIRIFDMAAGLNLDLGGAFVEKMVYNAHREDHKIENRKLDGGKKY